MADDKTLKAETREEAEPGLPVTVTRDVPRMTVELLPNTTISEGGVAYYGEGYSGAPEGHTGNDQVLLDGPNAIALVQSGHARIVGSE